jgi:hypothetical protein
MKPGGRWAGELNATTWVLRRLLTLAAGGRLGGNRPRPMAGTIFLLQQLESHTCGASEGVATRWPLTPRAIGADKAKSRPSARGADLNIALGVCRGIGRLTLIYDKAARFRTLCPVTRNCSAVLLYLSSVLEHSSGVWRCGSHACLTCSFVRPRKRSWSAVEHAVMTCAAITKIARQQRRITVVPPSAFRAAQTARGASSAGMTTKE